MLVGGTDVVDDGQLVFFRKMRDGLFAYVEHGPDLRDAGAAEIRYGLKAADAALVKKAHEKRFDGIVKVMAQRDLVAAQFQQHIVQRAPAHFCAHGAGVLLVPVLENDRADLRLFDLIWHVQLRAQLRHRGKIHARQAHVDGDGLQLIRDGIIPPQRGQQI